MMAWWKCVRASYARNKFTLPWLARLVFALGDGTECYRNLR